MIDLSVSSGGTGNPTLGSSRDQVSVLGFVGLHAPSFSCTSPSPSRLYFSFFVLAKYRLFAVSYHAEFILFALDLGGLEVSNHWTGIIDFVLLMWFLFV